MGIRPQGSQWLTRHWAKRTAVSLGLLPLSWLYCAVVSVRRRRPVRTWPVPVVVVGNLTVGGTGKTPLVAWLAQWLAGQGHRPGIVARGYGGASRVWPRWVAPDTDPREVGDEAVLLARRGWPVAVGPDRVAAVALLLERHDCTVVLSDDGLQHHRLARDVEIVVIGRQRFGNGRCLPAGPLREPLSRLSTVDARVSQGTPLPGEWAACACPVRFVQLKHPGIHRTADAFGSDTLFAVAGIGDPQRFFTTLRDLGLRVESRVFGDHHPFTAKDFAFVPADAVVVMTEKDAVKCAPFADHRFWWLEMALELDPGFGPWILGLLKERVPRG